MNNYLLKPAYSLMLQLDISGDVWVKSEVPRQKVECQGPEPFQTKFPPESE